MSNLNMAIAVRSESLILPDSRAGYLLHFELGFADLGGPLVDRMQAS